MKIKSLSIFVFVLAVLSAITWFINRPAPPPGLDSRTGQALITRDTLAAARSITLKDGGDEVTLTASENGGNWLVSDYYDFPVDFTKLSSLADNLRNAKVVRLVTRSPERMQRLDFGTSAITIDTGWAIPVFNLDVGKTSDNGGRFVRFEEEEKAYLADLSLYLDATPKNWAQSQLLKFQTVDVARLTVGFTDLEDALTIARSDAAATWEVESGQENGGVKSSDVTTLVNRFTSLRYTDTDDVGSEEATSARDHARSLSIELFDGTVYNVDLGRRPAPPAEEGPPEDPAAESPPEPKPGPVYVFIKSNRGDAPINELMNKRSFKISEYTFTSLPTDAQALLEPVPEPEPEIEVEDVEPVVSETDSGAAVTPGPATP
jgi:hypothetical protein